MSLLYEMIIFAEIKWKVSIHGINNKTLFVKLHKRKYLFICIRVIVGNVVLPQLCHLVHLGGPAMLPIYFFTLIGAYKYGFKVGMLTAVLSPLVNSFLFGMPSVTILPAILVKSVLLALVAGYMADRFRKITIPAFGWSCYVTHLFLHINRCL